jgi:transposase
MIHRVRMWIMGKPYSSDLRGRIIGYIEGGGSPRGAAEHFSVSPSCTVKLMERWALQNRGPAC